MLTKLEKQLKADEAEMLIPPEIRPVTDPALYPENGNFVQSGGFDRTRNGRLWVTWTGGGDNENAYALCAWSDNEGKIWTHPKFIIPNTLSAHGFKKSICCSVMWNDPLGRMWWIFDYRMGSFDGYSGTWYSICKNPDDESPVWSVPKRIWHGVSLNRPQVLSDGTWIMGISLWPRHRIYGFPGQTWAYDKYDGDYAREIDAERKCWIFASADRGRTWVRRGGAVAEQREFDEPSILERKDGSLLMYLRTYYGLAQTESFDQGWTWTEPKPAPICHPPARLWLTRLRSGRVLMVRHDRKEGDPPQRDNLTAWLSDDDGKSWYGKYRFECRQTSYPDGFQHPDGRIFVQYDQLRIGGSLKMSIFTEEDVAEGRAVSGKVVIGRDIMRTAGSKTAVCR